VAGKAALATTSTDWPIWREATSSSWTGCRKGAVPAALVQAGPVAAARELDRLIDRFGTESVVVELFDHDDPLDSARNDALAALAVRRDLGIVATNVVHHAQPAAAASPRCSPRFAQDAH